MDLETCTERFGDVINGLKNFKSSAGTTSSDEKLDVTVSFQNLDELTYYDPDDNSLSDLADITTYTIIFNANSGSGTMPNKLGYHGKTTKLSKNRFTKTGYDFMGWSEDVKATAPTYYDRQSLKITNESVLNLTLNAIWKIKTFYITFYPNTGTGSMPQQSATYKSKIKISKNVFAKTNYTFLGWSTNPNSQTATYTNEQEIELTTNLILYAVWKLDEYTITYNANGGKE